MSTKTLDQLLKNRARKKKSIPSKKPKDSNAPKKYLSSYFIYNQERRPILRAKHKDKTGGDISKLIGAEWRSMTEEDKEKYKKQSDQQRDQYSKKLVEYEKTDKYKKYQQKLKKWKQNQQDLSHKSLNKSYNKSNSNKNHKKVNSVKRTTLSKSLNTMSANDLKKEIKKRDKNQVTSKLNKSELKSMLFKQIQLRPEEIDKLKKGEVINELNSLDERRGNSEWRKKDLCDYLKYIHSNPECIDDIDSYIENDIPKIENKYDIPKNEFMKIPLFKLQKIYDYDIHERNHDKMYETLQSKQEWNSEWNEMMEKHLLLKQSIKNKQSNKAFDICGEWVMNEDFGYGNEDKYYLYINESDDNYYGSFLIGPIEGKLTLKSKGVNKYEFDWKGRETGENVIQLGDKVGKIKFSEFGTEAKGVLECDYGNFKFHAFRVSSDVEIYASQSDFESDEEEEYERERRNRW